jgi:hypothetical protein
LSSTRQANHHHVKPAGDSAGQPLNRVFERYRVRSGLRELTAAGMVTQGDGRFQAVPRSVHPERAAAGEGTA